MFDKDLLKLIGVMKLFLPLAGMMKNMAVPTTSMADPQPKEIEVNGKKEFVVIVRLAYNTKEGAEQLIKTYNEIDGTLRKLAV